uniref:Protein SERAC1 n=1 Tax=Noccaea caerulescens TaxID=107243 RepID=A0A1J3D2G9_NOCCA
MLLLRFNLLRPCNRRLFHRLPRTFSSSSPPTTGPSGPSLNLNEPHLTPSPPPHQSRGLLPSIYTVSPSSSFSWKSVFVLSAAALSTAVAYAAAFPPDHDQSDRSHSRNSRIYDSVEHAVQKSGNSLRRVIHHARQTGVAASVLLQSLRSVLSSANHEVRAGFELRVAALLADIASANAARRAALVGAGSGAVVDWLLETVAIPGDRIGAQDEAARALAYLIADPTVRKDALGRPDAVPKLLKFIFSCQPKNKKPSRRSSFDVSDSLKGRSMLVAAIMDIVTSNCDTIEKTPFKSSLPGNAQMRDIAAAIQVIEEGGMYFDEPEKDDDSDDGRSGIKGIGIKILEGTTVLGLSRASGLAPLGDLNANAGEGTPKTFQLLSKHDNSSQGNLSSAVIPGLWDDLHCQHVAVPFAAWALANWAMASDTNRSHIQELDRDGQVVMTALMAPERTVKWHGSLVARLLLEDLNLPLSDSVSDWSSSLLATVSHASKTDDISLAQVALSAFLVSVDRSDKAQKMVMEKGLPLMRDSARKTRKHKVVQEGLSKALELLCAGEMHLSLEESQKWSGILLAWALGKVASDTVQSSARRILSRTFEDYGPHSIPISQGWLTLIMNEILNHSKTLSAKGASQPKTEKPKVDMSKVASATQSTNQLAGAVVSLAMAQLGTVPDSVNNVPLADLLLSEPFAVPIKNLKKDSPPKFNAAESALATLKAIKSLTDVCAEDSVCQNKIVDFGILCLLRRFLLADDYEKLGAIEAYDASRALEARERAPDSLGESSVTDIQDPSSVRVPASAHIRRHAARLLTILSLLPHVQKVILTDETWCKWLDDCARGNISGCTDPKTQSYARASLLNIYCNQQDGSGSGNSDSSKPDISNTNSNCPRYGDMIFLINPGLPHWKCPEKEHQNESSSEGEPKDAAYTAGDHVVDDSDLSSSMDPSSSGSRVHDPEFDVIFLHGLRGGPFKTWRISEDKSSTKSGLVEKIDQEAGKMGTFWPSEWLSNDFPQARLFTLKYKTNLTEWSGATLPLQEVSSVILEKLVSAGIGERPVVFVTHSMGGLVVKQILHKAKEEKLDKLVNNTAGVVFYSCPHFGSKLADMPWRMGLVLRPAPSIGELRSGSPRLVELNDLLRQLHKKGFLEVLSFCETKVTPIVEGYGGWAFRMEIVPIESAYPGFGELVVLESTDHINSCKPLSRSDPSYTEALQFLRKLSSRSHVKRESGIHD